MLMASMMGRLQKLAQGTPAPSKAGDKNKMPAGNRAKVAVKNWRALMDKIFTMMVLVEH